MSEFESYDATALAAAIGAGEMSAREATESAIERIEALNPTLNAVIGTRFEQALAEVDAGLPAGPLTGVPTLVKALGADVAGLPTTRGSRLWADDVKSADSELVRRMKQAGMVVLGTTNTPELGKSASTEPVLHGPTPNPRDLTRSAGGASRGGAAGGPHPGGGGGRGHGADRARQRRRRFHPDPGCGQRPVWSEAVAGPGAQRAVRDCLLEPHLGAVRGEPDRTRLRGDAGRAVGQPAR